MAIALRFLYFNLRYDVAVGEDSYTTLTQHSL